MRFTESVCTNGIFGVFMDHSSRYWESSQLIFNRLPVFKQSYLFPIVLILYYSILHYSTLVWNTFIIIISIKYKYRLNFQLNPRNLISNKLETYFISYCYKSFEVNSNNVLYIRIQSYDIILSDVLWYFSLHYFHYILRTFYIILFSRCIANDIHIKISCYMIHWLIKINFVMKCYHSH